MPETPKDPREVIPRIIALRNAKSTLENEGITESEIGDTIHRKIAELLAANPEIIADALGEVHITIVAPFEWEYKRLENTTIPDTINGKLTKKEKIIICELLKANGMPVNVAGLWQALHATPLQEKDPSRVPDSLRMAIYGVKRKVAGWARILKEQRSYRIVAWSK